jgi:excisionase family DNA binding protein
MTHQEQNNVVFSQLPINDFVEKIVARLMEIVGPLLKEKKDVTPPKLEEYITRKEAAQILKVSLVTLHKYTTTGLVPAYRICRQIRLKESEVRQSMEKMKTM